MRKKIEVVLKHFYVRSNGARFWAGISTNATAWGTTDGLMEKHADEIVARLQ